MLVGAVLTDIAATHPTGQFHVVQAPAMGHRSDPVAELVGMQPPGLAVRVVLAVGGKDGRAVLAPAEPVFQVLDHDRLNGQQGWTPPKEVLGHDAEERSERLLPAGRQHQRIAVGRAQPDQGPLQGGHGPLVP